MSAAILVAGLINIETTLAIESFPLNYYPVTYPFFGVRSTVSGVGYNVAKALACLGHEVALASLIGADRNGRWVRDSFVEIGIDPGGLVANLRETCESVILYDPSGRRQIHTDLKDIQQQHYPEAEARRALAGCELAMLCNINFARPLLALAQQAGKPIATDVHVLASPDDDYNRDFMAAADILFLSDEGLHGRDPHDYLRELHSRYHNRLLVMGRGGDGALLYVAADRQFYHAPAVTPRPVVNTIGAGDALFSAFVHGIASHGNPYQALKQAVYFAGWKIGERGAAEGFISAAALAAAGH